MDNLRFVRIKGTPCDNMGNKTNEALKSFELNVDLIAAYDGKNVLLKDGSGVIKLGKMHYNNLEINNDSNTTVM